MCNQGLSHTIKLSHSAGPATDGCSVLGHCTLIGQLEMPGSPWVTSDGSLGEGMWRYSCRALLVLQALDSQGCLTCIAPCTLVGIPTAWLMRSAARRVGGRRDPRRRCLKGWAPAGHLPACLPTHICPVRAPQFYPGPHPMPGSL